MLSDQSAIIFAPTNFVRLETFLTIIHYEGDLGLVSLALLPFGCCRSKNAVLQIAPMAQRSLSYEIIQSLSAPI